MNSTITVELNRNHEAPPVARRWSPSAAAVVLRPAARSLSDVRPFLARIVDALGTNAAARLLDADRAQVSHWGGGKEQISGEMEAQNRRFAILSGIPALPGSVRAIGAYRLDANVSVRNLDDPAQLIDLALRPSDIVSRDYIRTREWARRLYRNARWAGVRWWSYYDPRWASFGIWDLPSLSFVGLRPLTLGDPALAEAARAIARRVVPR